MGLTGAFNGRRRRIWGECQLLGVWKGSIGWINSTFPPAQVLNQMGNKARYKQHRNKNAAFITDVGECGWWLRQVWFLILKQSQEAFSTLQQFTGRLVLGGGLLPRERRQKRLGTPGVGWAVGGERPGLPPHDSKHHKWKKLGFLICAVYLGDKHRVGLLRETLGLWGLCVSPTRDDQWVAGWVESKTQERMMAQ